MEDEGGDSNLIEQYLPKIELFLLFRIFFFLVDNSYKTNYSQPPNTLLLIRPSPKGRPLQECNGVCRQSFVWGHSLCPSVRQSVAARMIDD